MDIICAVVSLYSFAIIARAILSFFPVDSGSQILPVVEFLHRITEPVFAPIRRVIPPMSGFDLSPLIALIVINFVANRVLGC